VVNTISNTNQFNVDAVSTWRAAFRECVKLYASKTKENLARLEVWKTVGSDKAYGDYALTAAQQAIDYVNDNPKDLLKINDREWLDSQFKELNA
jgi:hypothetical protein